MEEETPPGVRLDRWLWAARWFKTRALAARALAGGKIRVNGERPKPARLVGPGDEVRIRRGPFEFHVVVRRVSEHRGAATVAQQLYEETAPSLEARARLALALKHQPHVTHDGKGRPTKRDRRAVDRLKRSDAAS
jgi:ribosome-associated heat shock protein Hsp15